MASTQIRAIEASYRSLRSTQRGLAGMMITCAVVGTFILQIPPGTLGNRVYLPVIFATSLLTFAYTVRNGMVLPALADLRRNPREPELLKRWHRNNLIVQALCAAVGLTGFALQLLGAATPIALVLYVIAVAYLFLLRPARP